MWKQDLNAPHAPPLLTWQDLHILPGLNAVIGDEGSGKTWLLRQLGQSSPDALWLDLRLPEHDELTPEQVWSDLQAGHPRWNEGLRADLTEALGLTEHLGKRLFMLSTGSRRKVGLVALLASGATVTCIDQPYSALDMASVRALREFLADMADHTSRAWVVADYTTDSVLSWQSVIETISGQ